MEENFDLLAQSRANYYTKGSPIQFVKVELLKGDVSGDIAVCMSFKNISSEEIVALLVEFKCKDRSGTVVCQDQFCYQGLDTSNGQVFGADDAVYISSNAIGSVEVELLEAYLADGGIIDLTGFPRTRLPAPKKLSDDLAKKLCDRTHKDGLAYVPQVLDQGWYCACGAFHPREEDGVWCSECGSDRILLQNTLSSLLQAERAAQPSTDEQPTRMVSPIREEEPTRAVPPLKAQQAGYNVPPLRNEEEQDDDDMRVVNNHNRMAAQSSRYARQGFYNDAEEEYADDGYEDDYQQDYEEDFEEDPRDVVAEKIIRWAPPVTALLCTVIAVVGFFLAR